MRIIAGVFFLALVSASTVSGAQHPFVIEKLSAWNAAAPAPSTAITKDQVMEAATLAQKRVGGCLPTSTLIESISPATGVRFVFQGIIAGRLRNGWVIVAKHPNCGDNIVRYTMVQDNAGALSTIRTNLGQSLANESLIGDTWPLALIQAESVLKRAGVECHGHEAILGITRIVEEETGLGEDVFGVRYKGSWTEAWPINLCGRTVEINVRFTADGDGGAYSDLKGAKAKLLPAGL